MTLLVDLWAINDAPVLGRSNAYVRLSVQKGGEISVEVVMKGLLTKSQFRNRDFILVSHNELSLFPINLSNDQDL